MVTQTQHQFRTQKHLHWFAGETPAIGPDGYCFAPGIMNLAKWEDNGHLAQFFKNTLAWHHWSPEQLGTLPMTDWKPNSKEKKLYGVSMARQAYVDTPWDKFAKGILFSSFVPLYQVLVYSNNLVRGTMQSCPQHSPSFRLMGKGSFIGRPNSWASCSNLSSRFRREAIGGDPT